MHSNYFPFYNNHNLNQGCIYQGNAITEIKYTRFRINGFRNSRFAFFHFSHMTIMYRNSANCIQTKYCRISGIAVQFELFFPRKNNRFRLREYVLISPESIYV